MYYIRLARQKYFYSPQLQLYPTLPTHNKLCLCRMFVLNHFKGDKQGFQYGGSLVVDFPQHHHFYQCIYFNKLRLPDSQTPSTLSLTSVTIGYHSSNHQHRHIGPINASTFPCRIRKLSPWSVDMTL